MGNEDSGLDTVRSATLFFIGHPHLGCLFFAFWAWNAGDLFTAPLKVGLFLTGMGTYSALLSYRFPTAGRVLLKGYYFFLFLALLLCFGLSSFDVLTRTPEDWPAMLMIFGILIVVSWSARKFLVTRLEQPDSASHKL